METLCANWLVFMSDKIRISYIALRYNKHPEDHQNSIFLPCPQGSSGLRRLPGSYHKMNASDEIINIDNPILMSSLFQTKRFGYNFKIINKFNY